MADYQANRTALEEENIGIIALSVDELDKAKETVDELKLDFPVAYGMEVPRDAEPIGAFWEERRKIFHATSFLLDSEGRVVDACYATGPVGRISAEDVLRPVTFITSPTRLGSFPLTLSI